jgi:hypothetical protein
VAAENRSSGDRTVAGRAVIALHARDVDQLFHALDPAPFGQKNLHPDAEEYVVALARELPAGVPAELIVYLDRPAGLSDESRVLSEAFRVHFARRAQSSSRRLRGMLRGGWMGLAIGVALLLASVVVGETIARRMGQGPLATVLRESLLIGGWVAMSRPIETFLYDWWAIRNEWRGYVRLSEMPVRVVYAETGTTAGRASS